MHSASVEEKLLNAAKYKENLSHRASIASHTPIELYVESSNICNLRCIMCRCSYDDDLPESPFISFELIEKMKDFNAGLLEAHLHGFGEPLLNREMTDIIGSIRRYGGPVVFDFFTNAVLLNRKMSETLVDAGLDRIILSIDGATRETYEAIHKGAKWETLLKNLADLNDVKTEKASRLPQLEINLIAMNMNFHEFPRLAGLAADHRIERITVKNLAYLDSFPEEIKQLQRVYRPEADDHIIAEAKRTAERHGIQIHFDHYYASKGRPEDGVQVCAGESSGGPSGEPSCDGPDRSRDISVPEERDRDICFQPWRTFYVKANGEVKPCCFTAMVMGDLRHSTPEEIWNGAEYRRLRDSIRRGIPHEGCSYCRKFDLRPRYDDTDHWLHVVRMKDRSADRRDDSVSRPDGSDDNAYRAAMEIVEEGRMAEAIVLLNVLIAARGDKPLWYNDLGCLHYALGDMSSARACLEKAVQLDPAFTEALRNLAGCYLESEGRLEEARGLYRRVLEQVPDDAAAVAAIERLGGRAECKTVGAG